MNHIDSSASVGIPPQWAQPNHTLQPSLPYVELDLWVHRQASIRRNARRWYQRRGGLHWLRLGRLTVQWSWRRA